MKYLFLITVCSICCSKLPAQDNLNLSGMIRKVDSTNIFISGNYYIWGASVVKGGDGRYYMFYGRWPHGEHFEKEDTLNYIFNGFAGWNKYGEIACAESDNITGPYHYVKTILKGAGNPSRWDRFTYANPLIREFNGDYYLYFVSNSFDSSLSVNEHLSPATLQWYKYNCTQKIGVIKAKTIKELISRSPTATTGSFIMEPDNKETFAVATNPAVTKGPDGKFYMMYKSRTSVMGHMTFWIATADKPDGPFKTVGPVMASAETSSEDPCLWYDKKRKRFYAVAKYFSTSLKLAPQFGALILLTSVNGIQWHPAKHTLVSLKKIRFRNGNIVNLDRLERPFIVLNENGQPIALFAAAAIKNPSEGNFLKVDNDHNTFNVQIPLK